MMAAVGTLVTAMPMLVALAVTAGLRVQTATPDALCPDLASVRAAVDARLGTIEGSGQWVASYTIVHRPDATTGGAGDVVRLELADPSGRLRMNRDLPRSGESCLELAQAIALVLDAYFRRPEAGGQPARRTPLGDGGVGPAEGRLRPGQSGGDDEVSSQTSEPGVEPGVAAVLPTLRAFGGVTGNPVSPAVGLELGMRLRARWVVALQGIWSTAQQRQTLRDDATVRLRSYALRAYMQRKFALTSALEVGIGPELFLALDWASANNLDQSTSLLRRGVGAGLQGAADLRLSRTVSMSVIVAADVTPSAWSQALEVPGYTGQVFPPPQLRLLVAAGLTFILWG